MDERLTKTQIRVLGALMSFRNKNTNLAWPKRENLSSRCGIPVSRISKTTTELVNLGWLTKSGEGGKGLSCHYEITVPDLQTVTKPVTVRTTETVTKVVTVTKPVTVTRPVTQTVTKPVTPYNEQTNEQKSDMSTYHRAREEKPKISRPKFDPERMVVADVIPLAAWVEFCRHRKAIRKPLTEAAAVRTCRTLLKLHDEGQDLTACIDQSIERGWTGIFEVRQNVGYGRRSNIDWTCGIEVPAFG